MSTACTGKSSLFPALFCVLGLLSFAFSPRQQAAPATGDITTIDASGFPTVEVRVAVRGEGGQPSSGLPASAFALSENGKAIPALTVGEAEIGVQVAFVLWPDDTFSKHDANGVSRLDYARGSIRDFVADRPWMRDNLDDVSVITPEGPLVLHSAVGSEVRDLLDAYAPASLTARPDGTLLTQVANALDAAFPVGPKAGAGAAVVVYASGLSEVTPAQIDKVATLGRDRRVPIYAIAMTARFDPETVAAANLRRLAEGSGGSLLYFETPDTTTPIFETIAGLRTQYRLTYRSTLAASGPTQVTVTISPPDASPISAGPASFNVNVLPPQVWLVEPPPQINAGAAGQTQTHVFRVQVAFPDDHPRTLKNLQLLVDGDVVSELGAPPFDAIAWQLAASEVVSGTHALQVTATDELGLSADSPPVQVSIIGLAVEEAAPATPDVSAWLMPAVGGAVVVMVLGVLIGLAFVVRRRSGAAAGFNALADREPVSAYTATQPVTIAGMPRPNISGPAREASRAASPSAPAEAGRGPAQRAYLEVVELSQGPKYPIELTGEPLVLGRDPATASITFADRSVSRRHARLETDMQGVFHIFDEGSTSGTWVNYEQVTSKGRALRHGDLINLGRVQLRFRVRAPEASVPGPRSAAAGAQAAGSIEDTTEPYKPKRPAK